MRKTIVLIVFLLMAMPVVIFCENTEEGYMLLFELTTTSDWTNFRFENCSPTPIDYKITYNEISKDDMDLKMIGISKPQYDNSKVKCEFKYFIKKKDLPDHKLEISIKKGDIGSTEINIFSVGDGKKGFIKRIENIGNIPGDSLNRQDYVISSADIRNEGRVEIEFRREEFDEMVLAFYYPWYHPPDEDNTNYSHWDPGEPNFSATNTPLLGFYSSKDRTTLKKHIEWAKDNGIDGFVVSWWGVDSFEDNILPEMVDLFEKEDFLFSIYYEKTKSKYQTISDFEYLHKHYFVSEQYITVDDRPVVFVFERAQESLSDNEWKYVLKRYRDNYGKRLFMIGDKYEIDRLEYFDGMHCYFPYVGNLEELMVYYSLFSNYCNYKGKLFTATVCPGLEDWRHIYGFSYDRDGGNFYKALWDMSIEENADWIAITSFNEWHEGTEIEPSIEFGRKYLELTDEFSKKFKR